MNAMHVINIRGRIYLITVYTRSVVIRWYCTSKRRAGIDLFADDGKHVKPGVIALIYKWFSGGKRTYMSNTYNAFGKNNIVEFIRKFSAEMFLAFQLLISFLI